MVLKRHPEFTYLDAAPNTAELFVLMAALALGAALLGWWRVVWVALGGFVMVVPAESLYQIQR